MKETDGGRAIRERFADRQTLVKIAGGFLVAGLLIYLLGVVVGWREINATLRNVSGEWLAVACLSTLLCLMAWSKAWQIVLAVVGIEVPYRRLISTYFAATFANYITPFGQAGGEPFIAYVLSQDTGSDYENCLASVVTADLLNLLPFFNFAALGMAVILLRAQLPEAIKPLAYGLTALALGIPALAYVGWNHRQGVENAFLRVLGPVARHTKRVTIDGARQRIERFYDSLEVIAAEPRELLYALVFSYTGWVFFSLPLYFAGRGLGLPIDPWLVLFIVPASTIAGFVPTPGGLAGVETALVVLLIALVPTIGGDAQAFAVATVYRVASYWFTLIVSGIGAIWVIYRA
ncbi:MAG: lysylphosphatidylglycerol synthase transmembrane domain-containing protein [Halobacteriales archaeon]|nr:lysylphosphatidylglycerol synthase transmembrane domain-containing protein [Halobacteriales archaeon]